MNLKCALGMHEYESGAGGILYCVNCGQCAWDRHTLIKNMDPMARVHPILRGDGLDDLHKVAEVDETKVASLENFDAINPATDFMADAFKSADEIIKEAALRDTPTIIPEDFAAPEAIIDRDVSEQYLADDFMSPDEMVNLEKD